MLHRNDKMLLRIAQADAYAMATEYIKSPRDDEVLKQALKFEGYVKHPTHSLNAGNYTDDTQMSIAVAEVLLEGPPYTKEKFADAFVRCFKRDPRDGYSRQFQKFLESIKDTKEFLAGIKGDSTKNGGCMRAVPIGVLKTVEEVLEVARIQASITHNTNEGIWSAQAIALMSHYALYSEDPWSSMGAFLQKHLKPEYANWNHLLLNAPWNDCVTGKAEGGVAIATTRACYTVIQKHNNLMDVLKQIIEWGGDTDSCAAISWGIASIRMKEDLPNFFYYGLEQGGKYGAGFLETLSSTLMEKYSI